MINGHALMLWVMATALISSQVSKLFAPRCMRRLHRNI
nr:hypothetical protein [Caballeronia calidae]